VGRGNFSTDPENPYFVWDWEDTAGYKSIETSSMATRFGHGDEIGLIRFREVFGDQPDQVPPGTPIISATLRLYPDIPSPGHITRNQKPGDAANLFEALTDWDETVRWETFGPTSGPDMGVDYGNQIIANTGETASDLAIDVSASLQAWSADPSENKGWVLMPAGAQDIISVSSSLISNATHVAVDIDIASPSRGELVVTLRHGDYTALLINRLNQPCTIPKASGWSDIQVTIDDAAPTDIHFAGPGTEPLSGTYKPDAHCYSLPLCSNGGTEGLCGQSADGDWVISVYDEHGHGNSPTTELSSWAIHLSDGFGVEESYSSTPLLAVPNRGLGGRWTSHIWSSESADLAQRPMLEVTYADAARIVPSRIQALPGTGVVDVEVTIPDGANGVTPVNVTISSDASSVAQATPVSLHFPAGGATTQTLPVLIGVAGVAQLTFANDSDFELSSLFIDVSSASIAWTSDALYRAVGDPNESLPVQIPYGANAASAVSINLATSDSSVSDFPGSVGGSLDITFPAGGSNVQFVDVSFGSSGTAVLAASDAGGLIAGGTQSVIVSDNPSVKFEVEIRPYLQLGDAPLGASTDQFAVVWQTTTLERQGPDHDEFVVEYRLVGSASWLPAASMVEEAAGSASRQNHAATITGLAFESEYEYRVTQLRNGAPIQSYQATARSRSLSGLKFTVSANSGGEGKISTDQIPLVNAFGSQMHVFNGDVVYYYGERELFRPRLADVFADMMSTILTVLVAGNHEISNPEIGQPYVDQVFMPNNGPVGDFGPGRNYSFDVGDVHFAVIQTGRPDRLENIVGPWLAADLAASAKPWKIVFTHELPLTLDPYSIDRQWVPVVRNHVLKAAVENGANLYIGGAAHSYQRYLPITAVDATNPVPSEQLEWASCASGEGTTLIYSGHSWLRPPSGSIPSMLEAPMEIYGLVSGIGTFEVVGDALTATAIDFNGVPFDSITINNCQNPANCLCPVCGDETVSAPEVCDDGNTSDGDGCSSICRWEYDQGLYGSGLGGFVEIVVDGVSLISTTSPGDAPETVLADLASQINSTPALGGAHAYLDGSRLISNSLIESLIVGDPGFDIVPPDPTYSRILYGVAQGGSVSITVEGTVFEATTTPSQLPASILSDLAGQINASPSMVGISASVDDWTVWEEDARLVTNGVIEDFVVDDPGLRLELVLPLLGHPAMLLLVLLLCFVVFRRTFRGSSPPPGPNQVGA
jgi:cysteine-rich repeat protein